MVKGVSHNQKRLTKRPLGHIRMAKPQTSLRSHASGQDLCYKSYIFNKIHILCGRAAKILTRMRGLTGWSDSALFAYVLRFLFSAAGPNNDKLH